VLTEGVDIHLPDFLIRLPFHMPYRQLERFARNLPKYIERSVAPYYIGLNGRGLRSGQRANVLTYSKS